MIGAIIGDIVGSRFEFNNTDKKYFKLFTKDCDFTDDTICTVAVADAILRNVSFKDSLLHWCAKYPNPMGAYGGSFSAWLRSPIHEPYNSFGNGSAMRLLRVLMMKRYVLRMTVLLARTITLKVSSEPLRLRLSFVRFKRQPVVN